MGSSLDAEGYQRVAASCNAAEMEVFIRRLITIFGGKVADDGHGLASVAQLHTRHQANNDFVRLIEEISDPNCSWVQPAGN